ncbi:MAG: hypothetical protein M3014_10790, partial [Chloroflexota bacterium]|nr:hypothetical protein [Chloroflexota bacterium]
MKAQQAFVPPVPQQAGTELSSGIGGRGEAGAVEDDSTVGTAATPGSGTPLDGVPLAAARLLWFLVTMLAVTLFILGIGARISNLKDNFPGRFPAQLSRNAAGQVVLSPWRNEPLMRAGVLEGDILLSVDGVPVAAEPGKPVLDGWLSRPVGTGMTIEVSSRNVPPRTYKITLGGESSRAIGPLGISADFVVTYSVVAEIAFALVFLGIAALLFARRSNDWLALLGSGMLVMLFVGTSSPVIALYGAQPSMQPLLDAWFAVSLVALIVFFYLFPTGHFTALWTRILAVVLAAAMLLVIVFPPLYPWRMTQWADFLVVLGCLGTVVSAQTEKYRRSLNNVQRQQTKWVVFGASAAALGLFAKFSLQVVWYPSSNLGLLYNNLLVFPAAQLFQVLLPVSILFAILRYKLFDIDIIINRALVYGSLTVCVFGVYMLIAGGLGALLQASG